MVLALFTGIVSGCGGGENASPGGGAAPAGDIGDGGTGTGSPAGDSGIPEPSGDQANNPDDVPGDGQGGQTGEPPATPADETGEPGDDAEIRKTHYMNKNYFLKPVDEDGDKNVVLLTFDDGPKEKEMLTDILDTLDKYEAKAIFFVNGFRVRQNPDLLRLIDERGHAIGNHSYDHIVLKNESEETVDRQLTGVQEIVEETVGKKPVFFRPPNGAGNDYIKAKAAELGMLYMTWSNGSLDWADNRNNPDGVIRSVMDQLHPGSIILMHELPWTAEALDELLAKIKEEGYSFIDPQAIEPEMR